MATQTATRAMPGAAPEVPAHIPPELVIDFNYITAAEAGKDPYELFEKLARSNVPRVFWSPQLEGHWVCLDFDDMIEACRDTEHFQSFPVGLGRGLPGRPRPLIPLEIDPPEHGKYRKLLGPLFTPLEIDKLRGLIRGFARSLVAEIKPRGRCDFVRDFSRVLPTTLLLKLVGMPLERLGQFLEWEEDFFSSDPERTERGGAAIARYIGEFVAQKRHDLGDDIASLLFRSQVDGKPLTDEQVFDVCFLLFIAGLDTVPNTFAFAWRYLAESPEAQERLRDRANIPDAVEELLRLNAIVSITRRARKDFVWHGAPLRQGDPILLPLGIINRDPKQFVRPTEVVLDRSSNRHVTFGAGHHRCLGSHLARAEFQIALEEWIREIPSFRLVKGAEPEMRGGGSMGLHSLQLEWDVAP